MSYSNENDSFVKDKEYIRKVVRNGDFSGNSSSSNSNVAADIFEPITNRQEYFWRNFQANGGKIVPCDSQQKVVEYLKKLVEAQQYNYILNTHDNLCNMLNSIGVNYENSISLHSPVDAVIALSTCLVARNGSIGFSQLVSRYCSMKNIAKDIIVISQSKYIVEDVEDAFSSKVFANSAGFEFITPNPVQYKRDKDIDERTKVNPRIILLLKTDADGQ